MLKQYEYKDNNGDVVFTYVKVDEWPEDLLEYRKEFYEWIYGQTCPVVEDAPSAVYSWDFVRWYDMRFKGIPTYFD